MSATARWTQLLIGVIDATTGLLGRLSAWMTVLLIVATCGVVFLRYFLGTGSIPLQESMSYLHSGIFMIGIAWTLKQGGHVRVDVFYRKMSPKTQAWIDVLGGLLFLLPVSVLLYYLSVDYVASSWAIRERSNEGTGIPFVYLLKTLLLILPVALIGQGVAEILKNILFIAGVGGSHTPEKVEPI